ncbi:MAG TPA: response regulator [Nitrososphaera sp.]|nr:response regulator [Nitrososphaera sp.]
MTLENSEKKLRILVVDDEPDIRETIRRGLEAEGFLVDSSGDPEEALALFRPGAYDLAILDIRLPKMNGFQLFREIRSADPRIRVCFITAFEVYYDEFKKVFPKIHVSCFVRKPVSIKKLAEIIREELGRPELAVGEPVPPERRQR